MFPDRIHLEIASSFWEVLENALISSTEFSELDG